MYAEKEEKKQTIGNTETRELILDTSTSNLGSDGLLDSIDEEPPAEPGETASDGE